MGVDYSANYGIGYKVNFGELQKMDIDDPSDHLYEITYDDQRYAYFQVGSGCYTGEENEHYIVLKKPELFDLKNLKDDLDFFLKRHKIKADGEFGLHGGLEIS